MKIVIPHVELSWDAKQKAIQEELARLMILSCRQQMPGVEIWQLADRNTKPLAVDHVLRKDFYAKSHWVTWLFSFLADVPGEVLFLDTDIIVRKDLRKLFELDADLVVTARKHPIVADDGTSMRILLGVAASRTPDVWREVVKRVHAMKTEAEKNWWGAQLATWDMLLDSADGKGRYKVKAVRQWEFNYVPKDEHDAPDDVWALHYKGERRKFWMLQKWGEQSRKELASVENSTA